MMNPSFRDILLQFLEEKSEDSALKTPFSGAKSTFSPMPQPLLNWQAPDIKTVKKNAYPRSAPRQNPPPPPAKKAARPVEIEVLLQLKQLKAGEQVQVEVLIAIGANELIEGISQQRLKKAHRRMVKTLHPDRLDGNLSSEEKRQRHNKFLLLQATYECLSRALANYANASACDNESASAPGFRRQDAA
jgi:hypothetical protein